MDTLQRNVRRRAGLTEWLLLLLALLTLGGTLAVWYALENARVTAAENDRLNALSKIVVKDMAVNLVAVNNALSGVIRDRLGGQAPVDRAALGGRLRALVEAMPGVRGIIVLGGDGTVVAAVPDDLIGRNFSQRSYFSVPKQRGDAGMLYVSPPFRSVRGDTVLCITRIVPGPGAFRGVVTAVLDPGYFSDILHTALYAPDLHAAIAHDDGAVFVQVGPHPGTGNVDQQLSASATIVPAGLHTDSAIGLTLRRDLAMVQAPLDRQARAFGAVCALLAVVGASMLAWFQGRRRRLLETEFEQERQRGAADTLRTSEARFRTLIEEAPVAVAIARQGRFIYTNRRYNALHGYGDADDLSGLRWRAMIAPASLRSLHEQLAFLDADAAVEQRFEAIGLGKGDALIPVLKATARVILADGPATLIFVQDITAQKSAETHLLEARDAAQAANRSKAEFLANMSHEIRTPLNAILGMAYLLERGNRDADAASMLQKIRTAGRSLLGIINDILDVSRIEAGAMAIERSWFDLQDVIDAVAASMGVAAGDKPVALLVQPLPPIAARVLGDALRIEQLLVNLTSNAIKFTERGRVELTVQAQAHDDGQATLTFRVTDTGIGIASAQQDTIFSPFTQADSSTTRRYGGSGLGLTICKQIVALMGGRIGVQSTEGEGSTFWFALTLPVRPAAASSSVPEMVNLDVLVAAAGDPAHGVLVDTARALDWRVRSAPLEAALPALLRETPASVVVLDWQHDGAACTAAARAIRAAGGVTDCAIVVLISTYQAGVFERDPARALVDALLTRPVTTSTLYNAVLEAKRNRLAQGGKAGQGPAPSQSLHGVRVLVVDDSGINRDVAERILREEGAEVVLAENGRSAVDWLMAHPGAVDLVLMDVQMPVMDGIEATRILRSMAQFAALPIVALTAGAFSVHQDAARDAGMNHFIAKPFDIPLTIELIRRLTRGAAGADLPADLPLPLALPAPAGPPAILDVRRGLATWGTPENYQRYLRKFAAAYSDVAIQLRRHIATGDTAGATALSHKLAGAAANVALPAVSTMARQLETASSDPVAGAIVMDDLDAAMAATLAALASYAPPLAAAAEPGGVLAPMAALAPLLARMAAALDEGMPEPALAVLAALAPHVPPALLAPIAACIDDFDWPGAARHTAALAGQHPVS